MNIKKIVLVLTCITTCHAQASLFSFLPMLPIRIPGLIAKRMAQTVKARPVATGTVITAGALIYSPWVRQQACNAARWLKSKFIRFVGVRFAKTVRRAAKRVQRYAYATAQTAQAAAQNILGVTDLQRQQNRHATQLEEQRQQLTGMRNAQDDLAQGMGSSLEQTGEIKDDVKKLLRRTQDVNQQR